MNFFIDLEYTNFGIEKALRTEKRASLLELKNNELVLKKSLNKETNCESFES